MENIEAKKKTNSWESFKKCLMKYVVGITIPVRNSSSRCLGTTDTNMI